MKKVIYFVGALIVILGLITISFGAGYVVGKNRPPDLPPLKETNKLELVERVIRIVQDEYVEETTESELIRGAAAGVIDALGDPYSHYLKKKHFERVEEETQGFYSGIGIFLGMKNGHITVQSVIDKTPAFRAGLKSGDIIISVNGKKTQGKSIDEVAQMIRGKEGTKVKLEIGREGRQGTFVVEIVREQIKIPNVESKLLEGGIGYIRIRWFNLSTSKDVQASLDELKSKGAKAFVIDLRDNPGGLLEQSIELASMFIENGKIVSVKGRSKQEEVYRAIRMTRDGVQLKLYKEPLVVLVNKGSASASEIFAGALKDHKRAILVGEKTFGKGSVQDVIKLPNGDGILLTIARYYTPSGRRIHNRGIEPDVKVSMDEAVEPGSDKDIQLKKAVEILRSKI